MMIRTLIFCMLLAMTTVSSADDMLLVVGAGGNEEYAALFLEWAEQWKQVANEANIDCQEIGTSGENDYDQLQQAIIEQGKSGVDGDNSPLWLVMIGHGTYDRKLAKFNLRGRDVEAKELASWLKPCARPLIVINAFSCSGAFLEPLQAPGRVVITATKNGAELNFSRFGGYMAEALTDMSADLDHDDQVSLLEAFLLASSNVKRFYESDSRLMTEHALLEDNQDGKGISADFFKGIRAEATAKDGAVLDGGRAHRYIVKSSPGTIQLSREQAAERDRIELEIEKLRGRKKDLAEDTYYQELEPLFLEMAELYAQAAPSAPATSVAPSETVAPADADGE